MHSEIPSRIKRPPVSGIKALKYYI